MFLQQPTIPSVCSIADEARLGGLKLTLLVYYPELLVIAWEDWGSSEPVSGNSSF